MLEIQYSKDLIEEEKAKAEAEAEKETEKKEATGACAKHQRFITTAVKRGRHIAVIPYSQD